MQKAPLANVLVRTDDFASGYPELYYRAESAAYDKDTGALSFSGTVDFSTYFNALSLEKSRGCRCCFDRFDAAFSVRAE